MLAVETTTLIGGGAGVVLFSLGGLAVLSLRKVLKKIALELESMNRIAARMTGGRYPLDES